MIQRLVRHPITSVWMLLVLATVMSLILGNGTESNGPWHQAATVGIIVVALVKMRLVISFFMDVRTAPIALRFATDAWLLTAGSSLTWLYLSAPPGVVAP